MDQVWVHKRDVLLRHFPVLQIQFSQFCMVDALRVVVLSFKFDQNRLSGYLDVRGQNLIHCITCTLKFDEWLIQPYAATVQA